MTVLLICGVPPQGFATFISKSSVTGITPLQFGPQPGPEDCVRVNTSLVEVELELVRRGAFGLPFCAAAAADGYTVSVGTVFECS